MKSFKQAFTMGLTGATAVFIATYFGLPTWVLFMAWVSYYLFGTNIKKAFLIFIQQVFGVFYISKIKYLNVIPAYFLGMIIGFGSKSEININMLLILTITLLIGYTFAWINVIISNHIESKTR